MVNSFLDWLFELPAKRHRVFLWVGLLLFLNWLSLAVLDPGYAPMMHFLKFGYFLGSLFAQTTLAAAWTAFGPGPSRIWRVPLSIIWTATLPIAPANNIYLAISHSGAICLGGCLFGQWLLLQFAFWTLGWGCRLRLRQIDSLQQWSSVERFRFGIHHLMVFMAVACAMLAIGRIILHVSVLGEAIMLASLATAAFVLMAPLLLAALMHRMAIPGVVLALLFTGVATGVESPLLKSVGASGLQLSDFISINTTSAILILIVAAMLRMNGYYLCTRPAAAKP